MCEDTQNHFKIQNSFQTEQTTENPSLQNELETESDDETEEDEIVENTNENIPQIGVRLTPTQFTGVGTQFGQYYMLLRDNTLQRVVFMTSQTEEDRLNNGFSAQLR